MAAIGRPVIAAGVASLYEGLLDGIVVDDGDPGPAPPGIAHVRLPDADGGADERPRGSPSGSSSSPAASQLSTDRERDRDLPVKRFGAAKQRLLDALDRPQRAALVKAMLDRRARRGQRAPSGSSA